MSRANEETANEETVDMLPPFIIEQIRKREEESRRQSEQPRLELPLPMPPRIKREADDEVDRGVIIVDLGSDS